MKTGIRVAVTVLVIAAIAATIAGFLHWKDGTDSPRGVRTYATMEEAMATDTFAQMRYARPGVKHPVTDKLLQLWRSGNTEDVKKIAEERLSENEDDIYAWIVLAYVYIELYDAGNAEAAMARVEELSATVNSDRFQVHVPFMLDSFKSERAAFKDTTPEHVQRRKNRSKIVPRYFPPGSILKDLEEACS